MTGEILQIVSAIKTDTSTITSTTMTDIPGLSIAITPSSATSMVLIMTACNFGTSNSAQAFLNLLGDGTPLLIGDAAGSRISSTQGMHIEGAGANNTNSVSITYLDSPATTSAVTYKLQASCQSGLSVDFNRSRVDGNSVTHNRSSSTILAMEIQG